MTDITSHHIIEIHRLNHSLGEFVRAGLRDIGNNLEASIDLLMGTVAQATLNLVDTHYRFNGDARPRRNRQELLSSAPAEHAYKAYASFVSTHYLDMVAQHPPAELGELPRSAQAGLIAAACRVYHDSPTLPLSDEAARSWEMACKNSKLAYQRVGALFFLASQAPKYLTGAEKARLDTEVQAAMSVLFRTAGNYEATEMKFAILMGGEALALTRQKIISKSFGKGMSVMQYLQTNESLPSRYSTCTEQSFRDTIERYAKAA